MIHTRETSIFHTQKRLEAQVCEPHCEAAAAANEKGKRQLNQQILPKTDTVEKEREKLCLLTLPFLKKH